MNELQLKDIVSLIDKMSEIIIENEVYFCDLDSSAGDGDFGMSLAKGFKELRAVWDELPQENIGGFLSSCGKVITEYCGGASGPIWGSAFRSAGKYASGKQNLNLAELGELLQSAVDGIQKTGGAKLGDKTLLDALIPATESLKSSSADFDNLLDAMKKAASEAVTGAENTKKIVATKGRATYLGDRSIGFPDAGAVAIGIIFTGLVKSLE
jgi:phosphoenolpyruvate---glycerone phosphotransferase subunit DhaL